MKLTGPDGGFELNILDYECSDSPYFMDRNWLIVSVKTNFHDYKCVRTAPILSTWEIELLLKWMRSVASGREISPKLTFVEPALGFNNLSSDKEQYRFGIKLGSVALPDWKSDKTPFFLPVTPDKRELQGAIQDLEQQMQRFPVRD